MYHNWTNAATQRLDFFVSAMTACDTVFKITIPQYTKVRIKGEEMLHSNSGYRVLRFTSSLSTIGSYWFKFLLLLPFCMILQSRTTHANPKISWMPLHEPGCGGRINSLAISPHDGNHVLVGGDMLGIGVSFDRTGTWQSTFGLESWEIGDFTFHPTNSDIIWAATMSGPCKSIDKGINWQIKRNGMPAMSDGQYTVPLQKIIIDPSNTDRMLAFGGSHRHWHTNKTTPEWGAVWESTNEGESWSYITTLGGSRYNGKNIMNATFAGKSSDTIWAAVYGDGVYISANGGASWSKRPSGIANPLVAWIESHPTNSQIAWIAMDNYVPSGASQRIHGRIYTTTDAGESWQQSSAGLPTIVTGIDENRTARYEIIRVSPTNPKILFTSNTSWPQAGLYLSHDGGATWQETAETFEKAYVSGPSMEFACFDPNDESIILASNASYVLRTIDGGTVWTDATSYRPAGKSTWRGRGYSGLVAKNFRFHHDNPAVAAFTAMDHGNFWRSSDTLFTWTWGGKGFPNFGGGSDISFSGTSTIFVTLGQSSSFSGIARSRDCGSSWDILCGNGLPSDGESNNKAVNVHSLPDDSLVVLATVGGKVYRSINCGQSWVILFSEVSVNWMMASSGNNPSVYLATDNGLYSGAMSGGFSHIPGGPSQPSHCWTDPQDASCVYVTSWRQNDGGVWRYDRNGWDKLSNDTYAKGVAVHPADDSIIVYTTDDHPYHDSSFASGVYLSTDRGESWTQQNDGLACLRGSVVLFNPHNPNQLVFGSGGRGFFLGTLDNQITSMSVQKPTTDVDQVNRPGETYNLLGRRIELHRDGIMARGIRFHKQMRGKSKGILILKNNLKNRPGH
jgi:hypothetical protein